LVGGLVAVKFQPGLPLFVKYSLMEAEGPMKPLVIVVQPSADKTAALVS
jgi:hypothetical protein